MGDSNGEGVKPPEVIKKKLPALKIKADLLKIRTLPYDDLGQKIEPEQQLVNRVMTVEGGAPVQLSRSGQGVGSIPMEIITDTSAGEVANAFRSKCFQCVAQGTLVLTERGVLPIEQIQGGQTYVEGQWEDIAAWAKTGEKEVMEVTTTHGSKVIVTPDHRIHTERGWISAADLKHEYRPGGSKDNRDVISTMLEMSDAADHRPDDALLLGVLTGDGWKYTKHGEPYGIGFSFEPDMEEVFSPVLKHAALIFDSREHVHDAGTWGSNDLVGPSSQVQRRIFWRNAAARKFADGIDKENVPAWIWRSTLKSRAAYLRGLFTTDGSMCVNPRPTARFYQTSQSLTEQVRLLLRSVGIHSTISCEVRRPRFKDLFQVTIGRQRSLERFVNLIGFMDDHRMKPLMKTVADRRGKDRASPERVKSVKLIGTMPVYDISVPGPDSFYGNGVLVHNCKHFNRAAWNKLRLLWGNSSDPEIFQKLNRVRYALLTTQDKETARRSEGLDGDFDVEHAISMLGICEPLSELNRDPVIVSPISTCPDQVCTKENPRGLFKAKDKEHERMGSAAFDQIMKMAAGKAQGIIK